MVTIGNNIPATIEISAIVDNYIPATVDNIPATVDTTAAVPHNIRIRNSIQTTLTKCFFLNVTKDL